MRNFDHPLNLGVIVEDSDQLRAIYACLASPVIVALVLGTLDNLGQATDAATLKAPAAPKPAASPAAEPTAAAPAPAGEQSASAAAASPAASDAAVELDTGGHPWSADLHASTKGKTKDGYWRMKVGVSRPADLPGFPATAAAAPSPAASPSPSATDAGAASAGDAGASSAAPAEDDEFAAFRAADAAGSAAAAEIPARTWTDADLSKLCNQAAQKLGDPGPVKELIASHVPEGEVPHSRNIPADQREAFASAVETKAGIVFAG
jgi:hypothetical protein